jgi:hypothetical protein
VVITLGNMGSSGQPQASPEPGIPENVRAEVLDVIQDVLEWQLAEARWPAIEHILMAMDAACRMGDQEGLETATVDLELAGPLRITRIGATPIIPAPPPIRNRLNQLVFALGGTTLAAQPQPAEDDGTGNDVSHRD